VTDCVPDRHDAIGHWHRVHQPRRRWNVRVLNPDPLAQGHRQLGSLDDFVGASEQSPRNGETDRPSNLQVNDEIKLGRHLNRQFRWIGALEDEVDIGSSWLTKMPVVLLPGRDKLAT
jgi:hypothetical protein